MHIDHDHVGGHTHEHTHEHSHEHTHEHTHDEACGHDCHTSMLLTAAALLKKHEEELQGQVILMFQPDEEGTDGTGARMMVENGLLDKYKPDVAVMAHMASDIVKTNQIMLKSGPCSASARMEKHQSRQTDKKLSNKSRVMEKLSPCFRCL